VTEVQTSPPAVETRACPRCGAELAPDQEWCLSCGNAVGTRVAPTPRWKLPVFLVAAVLTLLLAALVLSLVELGGDPQPVAKQPAAGATPTPSAAPDDGTAAASPTTAPQPSATPEAAPGATPAPGAESEGPLDAIPTPGGTTAPGDTGGTGTGGLASWPDGKTAWTVIIASTGSRAEAEKKARAAGADAGVLHSDDFSSLRKGYWVVFAGQYPNQKAAQSAAEGKGGDAYARRVVPR
jgi:hypothetical protein